MIKIQIIGNIGRDAEVKDFNDNQIITFPVAVSETYTNKQGEKVTNTVWFEVSKWGNNTAVAKYIKKGNQIYVEGKVNNRAYVKEGDGSIVVVNGITAFDIQLLGSKSDSGLSQSHVPTERPQANTPNSFVDGEDDVDGLPF